MLKSKIAAMMKRNAAPQNGGNPWLLNFTATKFTPKNITTVMKAAKVNLSGLGLFFSATTEVYSYLNPPSLSHKLDGIQQNRFNFCNNKSYV
jgi:hypothetical protein